MTTSRGRAPFLAAGVGVMVALGAMRAGAAQHGVVDDDGWRPGNETTSRVRGEAEPGSHVSVDGVYGRFDGDLDLGFGLGAVWLSAAPLPAARISLHYFSTAGIAVGYADAMSDQRDITRSFWAGVDVRPAFLPRWARGAQTGPALVDLTIDSISLGLGAYLNAGDGGSRGLDASLGFGVPLLAAASGPWIEARGALRVADAGLDAGEATGAVLVFVSWHGSFVSRLVTGRNR